MLGGVVRPGRQIRRLTVRFDFLITAEPDLASRKTVRFKMHLVKEEPGDLQLLCDSFSNRCWRVEEGSGCREATGH